MNFDKFKQIKPRSIEAPSESEGYSKELLSLESKPSGAKTISVISSVAAAILIVTVVGVWAIIGRGIQQSPTPSAPSSDNTQQKVHTLKRDGSVTTLQRRKFFDIFAEYKINAMPVFNEGEVPDINDMAWYIFHLNQSNIDSGQLPSDVFNKEVNRLFGFEYNLGKQESIVLGEGELQEYPFAELINYSEEQTQDGTVITATAAVYYMWNLVEQNCEDLYPEDFAIAKGTVTSGSENIDDISAIYEIKYVSGQGITPIKFLSLKKHISPEASFLEFFDYGDNEKAEMEYEYRVSTSGVAIE